MIARFRIVVVLALLAAACSGGDAEETTTTTTTTAAPTTTTTAAPTTTTTTLPPNVDAGLDLPRSATYAHVAFVFTSAEYSNATPGTYLEDEPQLGEDRYLFVGFTAGFEPDYPGRSEQFDAADFSLVLADGTATPSEMVDFRTTITVTPEGAEHALAFPGDDLDLAGAAIVFDNEVNEPMTVALDGAATADPYPITVDVDASGDVAYEGGCNPAPGTVNVLDAEWDLDGGVDEDGETIVTAGTARTVAGERFVRVRVQAIAVNGNCGGSIVGDDAFRLIADGLPLAPENRNSVLLDDGAGAELVWAYRVPSDVAELILEAGLAGETVAQFAVPIPDPLP